MLTNGIVWWTTNQSHCVFSLQDDINITQELINNDLVHIPQSNHAALRNVQKEHYDSKVPSVGTMTVSYDTSSSQRMLQQVTQELVTCPQDLDSFGLHLGFSHSEIDRARNNNPNNIEGAALRLACVWWSEAQGSKYQKEEVSFMK